MYVAIIRYAAADEGSPAERVDIFNFDGVEREMDTLLTGLDYEAANVVQTVEGSTADIDAALGDKWLVNPLDSLFGGESRTRGDGKPESLFEVRPADSLA